MRFGVGLEDRPSFAARIEVWDSPSARIRRSSIGNSGIPGSWYQTLPFLPRFPLGWEFAHSEYFEVTLAEPISSVRAPILKSFAIPGGCPAFKKKERKISSKSFAEVP